MTLTYKGWLFCSKNQWLSSLKSTKDNKKSNAAKTNSFRNYLCNQGAHGQDFGQEPGKAYWCVCDACFLGVKASIHRKYAQNPLEVDKGKHWLIYLGILLWKYIYALLTCFFLV